MIARDYLVLAIIITAVFVLLYFVLNLRYFYLPVRQLETTAARVRRPVALASRALCASIVQPPSISVGLFTIRVTTPPEARARCTELLQS